MGYMYSRMKEKQRDDKVNAIARVTCHLASLQGLECKCCKL